MADSVKPKTARKTAVWKLRRDYVSSVNAGAQKSADKLVGSKETKLSVRAVKNLSVISKVTEPQKTIAVRPATVRAVKTEEKPNKVISVQPNLHAVIKDQKLPQKASSTPVVTTETHQLISVPSIEGAVEKGRTIVRTTDLKTVAAKPAVAKTIRPPIIKKTVIKDGVPVCSIASTAVVSTRFEMIRCRNVTNSSGDSLCNTSSIFRKFPVDAKNREKPTRHRIDEFDHSVAKRIDPLQKISLFSTPFSSFFSENERYRREVNTHQLQSALLQYHRQTNKRENVDRRRRYCIVG